MKTVVTLLPRRIADKAIRKDGLDIKKILENSDDEQNGKVFYSHTNTGKLFGVPKR